MPQGFASSKVALVTGVSRAEGIGFEVCRQLADPEIAERLAKQLMVEGPNRDVC